MVLHIPTASQVHPVLFGMSNPHGPQAQPPPFSAHSTDAGELSDFDGGTSHGKSQLFYAFLYASPRCICKLLLPHLSFYPIYCFLHWNKLAGTRGMPTDIRATHTQIGTNVSYAPLSIFDITCRLISGLQRDLVLHPISSFRFYLPICDTLD